MQQSPTTRNDGLLFPISLSLLLKNGHLSAPVHALLVHVELTTVYDSYKACSVQSEYDNVVPVDPVCSRIAYIHELMDLSQEIILRSDVGLDRLLTRRYGFVTAASKSDMPSEICT